MKRPKRVIRLSSIPTSANNLHGSYRDKWNSGRKVYRKSAYRDWLDEAMVEVLAQKIKPVPPKTGMMIRIKLNVNRKRDIDNCIKSTLDMLQTCGIIPDDRYVDSLTINRDPEIEGTEITIQEEEWYNNTLERIKHGPRSRKAD